MATGPRAPLTLRRGQETLVGGRETFCGLPARTDPQKVSGALMDPLADALRGEPKWLKSSWKVYSANFAMTAF